ncbi:MAG TPA: R3H domain-containing nucleic acid-binding protein, partial [Thermoanaerobaculia bacterium]|nr:R3H domain-containing nucleic acid-binding protein [Thermoanaerobaculia bacterium]
KTVLERKAPPTFGVLIEIQDKDHLAVHHDVAEVVDRFLRDVPPRPEIRTRNADGSVEIQKAEAPYRPPQPRSAPGRGRKGGRGGWSESRGPGRGERSESWEGRGDRTNGRGPAGGANGPGPGAAHPPHAAPAGDGEPEPAAARPPKGRTARIYPYAVSKSKLERAIRKLRVPAIMVEDLDDADLVVTLKAQERRQPRRLRDAAAGGVPVYIMKSNTIVQAENFLRAVFDVGDVAADDEEALREVEDGIDEVLDNGEPVELPPRNNHLRRLQHQVVERYGLTSESKGDEPYRRVVIYPG